MMDFLEITGLTVNARIGIHAYEQAITQPLLIDLKLPMNIRTISDELSETLDYAKLSQIIIEFAQSRSFGLIETVANQLMILIIEYTGVMPLELRVSKPFALAEAKNVSITLVNN